jgi:hypothetical protein
MKATNEKVLSIKPAVEKLLDKPLAVIDTFKVVGLVKQLNEAYKQIQETAKACKGNQVNMAEILAIEVELTGCPINILVGPASSIKELEPSLVLALDPIITFEMR